MKSSKVTVFALSGLIVALGFVVVMLGLNVGQSSPGEEQLGTPNPNRTKIMPLHNPSLVFVSTSPEIDVNESSDLLWTAIGATSCVASGGWTGPRAASGSLTVSPSQTTTYTLSCNSASGGEVSSSTTIIVHGGTSAPQCSDGIDNDGDGLIDLNDPGCTGPSDNDEFNSPTTGLTLTPGNGWNGQQTAQPPGTGPRAIAQWDTVPYQTVNTTLNVGVVAFNVNGIQKVSFSVENGPWVDVMSSSVNPQTNVNEYWATIDASQFSTDRQTVEVRAIVYPNTGTPVVLQGAVNIQNGLNSMFLSVNGHGTLSSSVRYVSPTGNDQNNGSQSSPFQTIYAAAMSMQNSAGHSDNATIYLLPGNYSWTAAPGVWMFPSNTYSWLTIAAAPGTTQSQVSITSAPLADRISTHLVHFKNLTLTAVPGELDSTGSIHPTIWYDTVQMTGGGRNDHAGWTAWSGGAYLTDSNINNSQNPARSMTLIRNVNATNIGEDAYSDSHVVINASASINSTGVTDSDGSPAHADFIEDQGPTQNTIWYGVTGNSGMVGVQGLTAGGNTDMAIVDANVATDVNQFYMDARLGGGIVRNLYMKNDVFSGTGGLNWSVPSGWTPLTTAIGVVVENCWRDAARTIPISQTLGQYPGVTYR